VKKKLALLLAFALVFTMLPVTVAADHDADYYDDYYYDDEYDYNDFDEYDEYYEDLDEYYEDLDEYYDELDDYYYDLDEYYEDLDEYYEDLDEYYYDLDEDEYVDFEPISADLDDYYDVEPIDADLDEEPADLVTPVVTDERVPVTLVFEIDSTTFTRNGLPMELDVAPFIAGGRTMLPFAALGNAIGAETRWEGETRTVYFYLDDLSLSIAIGQELPGGMGTADIVGGRTFVPVAFVGNQLGGTTAWDGATRTVTVVI